MKTKLNNAKEKLSIKTKLQNALHDLSLQKKVIKQQANELIIAKKKHIPKNHRQCLGLGKLLKRGEAKQKTILQNVMDFVFIVNPAGEILYINHAFPGHTENEMFGINWLQWLDIKDRLKAKKAVRQLLITGKFTEIQARVVDADKKPKWFNIKMVRMPNLTELQVLMVATDISEQRKNEKALIDYKYAINESSIIAITDQKGIIKHVNENFCNISQYNAQELIGQDHRKINSGYHPKSYIRNLWVTIANGKIWRGEMCNRAKDGTIYWVDTTIVPILDEHGKPIQYMAIRADITDRKKAEEEKKLLAKRLLLATNSAGMGFWHLDTVKHHLGWDEAMYKLYGMKEKQIGSIYEEWTSKLHPQDRERIYKDIEETIAGRKEYDTDFRIVLDDSSVRYIKVSGIVERDADGKAVNMIGVSWNITELKEQEQLIRKSDVFNRTVLNSLSAHLAVVNDKGIIISINDAWKSFARLNGDSSLERTGIGSNYFKVCEKASMAGDEISGQVLHGMKDVLNKERKDFYIEYPCHSPSEQRWFGLSVTKFEGDDPLILVVHTNLTERILSEFERQKTSEDLVQRNKALEQFTYIISHNLRAPVANIIGLSELLVDESQSKNEARSIVKHLISSVQNLDTVIADLNNILHLNKGVTEAKECVSFSQLIKEIKKSIHSQLLKENVTIITQFIEVTEMNSIKGYLYSIFYNLISNSIKYKRQDVHPVIEIKSIRIKDTIELVFKDNGRGINLKNSGDQLFGLYKRFYQDIEGKGVGLFMVKTQVEALGGKISVESEVNKGTEFRILFTKEKNNVH